MPHIWWSMYCHHYFGQCISSMVQRFRACCRCHGIERGEDGGSGKVWDSNEEEGAFPSAVWAWLPRRAKCSDRVAGKGRMLLMMPFEGRRLFWGATGEKCVTSLKELWYAPCLCACSWMIWRYRGGDCWPFVNSPEDRRLHRNPATKGCGIKGKEHWDALWSSPCSWAIWDCPNVWLVWSFGCRGYRRGDCRSAMKLPENVRLQLGPTAQRLWNRHNWAQSGRQLMSTKNQLTSKRHFHNRILVDRFLAE